MESNANQLRAAARALDEIADRIEADGPSVSGAETIKTATGQIVPTDIGDHSKLAPGIYLALWHGRKTPDEELQDWGSNGPVIGPLTGLHVTYGTEIALAFASVETHDRYFPRRETGWTADISDQSRRVTNYEQDAYLHIIDGLVEYNGVHYGDWGTFIVTMPLPALIRSLLADLRSMQRTDDPDFFGPFVETVEGERGTSIEWPNLRILLDQIKQGGY